MILNEVDPSKHCHLGGTNTAEYAISAATIDFAQGSAYCLYGSRRLSPLMKSLHDMEVRSVQQGDFWKPRNAFRRGGTDREQLNSIE